MVLLVSNFRLHLQISRLLQLLLHPQPLLHRQKQLQRLQQPQLHLQSQRPQRKHLHLLLLL